MFAGAPNMPGNRRKAAVRIPLRCVSCGSCFSTVKADQRQRHMNAAAIARTGRKRVRIESAESLMDPFNYCNRRADDNTPSLSCTAGGTRRVSRAAGGELQSPDSTES